MREEKGTLIEYVTQQLIKRKKEEGYTYLGDILLEEERGELNCRLTEVGGLYGGREEEKPTVETGIQMLESIHRMTRNNRKGRRQPDKNQQRPLYEKRRYQQFKALHDIETIEDGKVEGITIYRVFTRQKKFKQTA